jgi:hypothetical protein
MPQCNNRKYGFKVKVSDLQLNDLKAVFRVRLGVGIQELNRFFVVYISEMIDDPYVGQINL